MLGFEQGRIFLGISPTLDRHSCTLGVPLCGDSLLSFQHRTLHNSQHGKDGHNFFLKGSKFRYRHEQTFIFKDCVLCFSVLVIEVRPRFVTCQHPVNITNCFIFNLFEHLTALVNDSCSCRIVRLTSAQMPKRSSILHVYRTRAPMSSGLLPSQNFPLELTQSDHNYVYNFLQTLITIGP